MKDDLLIIDSVIPSTSTSSPHTTAKRNGSAGSDFGGEATKRNTKSSSLMKMNSSMWGGGVLDDSMMATSMGGNPNMKNAGRKKTNPAWEFFIDMREKGMTGVCCRHCDFYSEDRSPTLLKFHVKRFHDTGPGGLWHQLKEKYDWSVPHKYNAKKKNCAEPDGSYIDKMLEEPSKMLFNNCINDIGKLENGCGLMMNLLLLSSQQSQQQQQQQRLAYAQQPEHNLVGDCRGSDAGSSASPPNNGAPSTRSATVTPFSDAPSMLSDGSGGGSALEKPKEEPAELDASFPVVSCDWSRLLPNVGAPLFRKEEMVNRAVDLSKQKRPRNANVWQYMGTFDSEDEMHKVRIREKVSKRRTEQLRNGIKVRYRCNKWKRTKCAYQMFALFANDKIDLYETGVHDHSGDRMQQHALKMQNKRGGVAAAAAFPSSPRKHLSGKNAAASPTASSDAASETRKELLRSLMLAQSKSSGNAEIVTVAPFGVNYSAASMEDLTNQNVENLLNACCQYIKEEGLTTNVDSGSRSDEPVAKRFCLGNNMEGNGGVVKEEVCENVNFQSPVQQHSSTLNHSDVGLSSPLSAVALAAAASASFGDMSSVMEFLVGFNNAYTQLMNASGANVEESNGGDKSGKCCAVDETVEDVGAACTVVEAETTVHAKLADTEEEQLIVVDDDGEAVAEAPSTTSSKEAESKPVVVAEGTFSLMDTQRLAELVEIATKLKLTLAFTNKDGACKYIFYPKEAETLAADSPTKGRRSIALSEEGANGQTLCVEDLLVDDDDEARSTPTVVRSERWRKSDWAQFLWAIRGKCAQYFCTSAEEPTE